MTQPTAMGYGLITNFIVIQISGGGLMNSVVLVLFCIALLLFPGCGVKEVAVTEPQVIQVLDGKGTKPLSVGRIVSRIPVGKPIVRVKGGLACIQAERDTVMPADGVRVLDPSLVQSVFYETVKGAGYQVIGDPGAIFEEDAPEMSQLVVGGALTDVWLEICLPYMRWGVTSGSGNATISVEWQVYDRINKKVIYRHVTKGSANIEFGSFEEARSVSVRSAFQNALMHLLSRKEFLSSVSSVESGALHDSVPTSVTANVLDGIRRDNSKNKTNTPLPEVLKSVVTVLEGKTHGSGFFITANGFIMTNQHVVGNMDSAHVMLHDGRKVEGKVVFRDVKRDVAIIKIDANGLSPLSFYENDLSVGTEVFAIGSPKDVRLAGSVTKGIVSGYRFFNGVRWLQSDAAINPGNSGGPLVDGNGRVVGISTLSRRESQGIFFFGPSKDLLETINAR